MVAKWKGLLWLLHCPYNFQKLFDELFLKRYMVFLYNDNIYYSILHYRGKHFDWKSIHKKRFLGNLLWRPAFSYIRGQTLKKLYNKYLTYNLFHFHMLPQQEFLQCLPNPKHYNH